MTEDEKFAATSIAAAKQKSLEMLFDYTKFHIGVYLTLTASYLTAATANLNGHRLLNLNIWLVWPAISAFAIAGLAGGVIISSITQRVGGSSNEFLEDPIGPWDWTAIHFRGRIWTYIEHTSFWLGLLFAVSSFVHFAAPPDPASGVRHEVHQRQCTDVRYQS